MLSKIFMGLLSTLFACIKFDIEKVKQLYKGLRCKMSNQIVSTCYVCLSVYFLNFNLCRTSLSGKLKLPKNELVTLVTMQSEPVQGNSTYLE